MYAPFYRAYIPATRAELPGHAGISSGTERPIARTTTRTTSRAIRPRTATWAACRTRATTAATRSGRRSSRSRASSAGTTGCARRFNNGTPDYRNSPTGDQAIVIYSDEHGEAMTQYVPGWDFYFDQLIAGNPQIITPGNGCDLKDIYPLGTAQIKATARYPGQRVTRRRQDLERGHRDGRQLLHEGSLVRPKGTSGADLLSWICTATAIDIDNTALNDENVCFTAPDAEGIKAYPSGTASTTDALGRICVMTNWSGEAAIEIFGKCSKANAPVNADFLDEKIKRSTTADLSYCPSTDDRLDDDHDDDDHDATDDDHDRRGRRPRRRAARPPRRRHATTRPPRRPRRRRRPRLRRRGRRSRSSGFRSSRPPGTGDADHALPERARQRDAEDGQDRGAARQEERQDAPPGAAEIKTNVLIRVPQLKLDSIVKTVKVTLVS